MIKQLSKTLAPYRTYLSAHMLLLQIISIVFSTIFQINLWIIDGLLLLLGTCFFIFLKDISNDDVGKLKYFRIYKWQMIIGLTAFVNDFMWSAAGDLKILKMIGFLLLFMIPIGLMAAMTNEVTKEAINDLVLKDFWENFSSENNAKGNVVLGIDKETNKPMYLKEKDRFLHMLILGPTGCGKTSQIITPMISKDLQNHDMGVIVLEPKGDLAEKVFALAKFEGRKVQYFNPMLKDCPYFNPLRGNENDVIENLVTTLKSFDTDSKGYFQDNNENLIRRSVKVLKRLYGDDATLIQLDKLINNVGGEGAKMINAFQKLPTKNIREKNDNDSIASWFVGEYLPGTNGGSGRGTQKTFEASSGVRNQIQKLIANGYLNKVLNPPTEAEAKAQGIKLEYLDFDKILREGNVCAISSAQGKLRELGKFLGFFLILQIQSSVFRRPGNEFTRRGCMLYIDEFQTYANPGMQDMLTQGRSYRVGCILATQNRALIGMNSGGRAKSFTDLVSTNARNIVIFPGANSEDATYYSREFGEEKIIKDNISVSRNRYGFNLSNQKETVRQDEKYEARFRNSDIIYKGFGEAVVRIIKDNSVELPRVIKLSFIPKELNDRANEFVNAFNADQLIDEEEDVAMDLVEDNEDEGFFLLGDAVEDLEEYGSPKNSSYPTIDMPSNTKASFAIEEDGVEDFIDDLDDM